ncbi:MAG: hypothetical protein AAF517_01565 [Planctomycetota bacterium]
MTTDSPLDPRHFDDLLREASDLPYGDAKMSLLDRAVRMADAAQDLEKAYEARYEYVQAGHFSGFETESLVAFSWLLAQTDADPTRHSEVRLLWPYKWIISDLPNLPNVTFEKIEELFADFKRRYDKFGASPRTYHYFRMLWQSHRGDHDAVRSEREKYRRTDRDYHCDCDACEQNHEVTVAIGLGDHAEALELAKPILAGGMNCATVPDTTYADILVPLVEREKYDLARHYHETGYRRVVGKRDFLSSIARHLTYAARVGRFETCAEIIERHFSMADGTKSRIERFNFLIGVWVYAAKLRDSGTDFVPLRTELNVTRDSSGSVSTSALAQYAESELTSSAASFDKRNRTSSFAGLLDQTRDWIAAPPVPFPNRPVMGEPEGEPD